MSRNLFARATELLMSNESSSGIVSEVGGSAGSNISFVLVTVLLRSVSLSNLFIRIKKLNS